MTSQPHHVLNLLPHPFPSVDTSTFPNQHPAHVLRLRVYFWSCQPTIYPEIFQDLKQIQNASKGSFLFLEPPCGIIASLGIVPSLFYTAKIAFL